MTLSPSSTITHGSMWGSMLALASCAAVPAPVTTSRFCEPPLVPKFEFASERAMPEAGASRPRHMASLLGLDSTFRKVLDQAALASNERIDALERVELATLMVSAVAGEIDCESERADMAAWQLAQSEDRLRSRLTVASIVLGGATGIAGGILLQTHTTESAQGWVAIGGGTASAGIGLASLRVRRRTFFAHPRNLLADFWSGPAVSSNYPPVVWAYLNRPTFSNEQRRSIRQNTVERWLSYGVSEKDVAGLYFGSGGDYDVEQLRTRAAMLSQVNAEVELMNQELAALEALLARSNR